MFSHSLAYVRSMDQYHDQGHDTDHCLRVNQIAQTYYQHTGTHFTQQAERQIIELSAIFHEQDDPKFPVNFDQRKIRQQMTLDGIIIEEQNVVIDLITCCSFKKRKLVSLNYPWQGLLNLLCSADLAEAVGQNAITRSYNYHRWRLGHGASIRDIWSHVIMFYESEIDGYFPRLNAIKIKSIRDMVEPYLIVNQDQIDDIKQVFEL